MLSSRIKFVSVKFCYWGYSHIYGCIRKLAAVVKFGIYDFLTLLTQKKIPSSFRPAQQLQALLKKRHSLRDSILDYKIASGFQVSKKFALSQNIIKLQIRKIKSQREIWFFKWILFVLLKSVRKFKSDILAKKECNECNQNYVSNYKNKKVWLPL